ncbi:hypothetical protein ACOJIV_07625 [Haloarcula sp. AONF1]
MSTESSGAVRVRVDKSRFMNLLDAIEADFDRVDLDHDINMSQIGDIALAVGIRSGLPDEELGFEEEYPFNLSGLDPDGFMESIIRDEIRDKDIEYRNAVEQLLRQGLRTLHEDHDNLGGDDSPFMYGAYLPDEVINNQNGDDSS